MWARVCKGVEVRRMNGNIKSFFFFLERGKVLKQPNETNSTLKTLNKIFLKKFVLKH